jgi:hypothetical protein
MTTRSCAALLKASGVLWLVLTAGCGAVLNRSGVDDSQLSQINSSLQYPHNYSVEVVDGVRVIDVSLSATAFRKVEPGKHQVTWMKKTFGDYVARGVLIVEFEPGGVYKVGVRKGDVLVSIWDIETDKVVSTSLK